ncbi:MAG: hypothetical protein COB34_06030 [Methylophilaceae bacterium]|nr:MAG: hypothetical protein COB34_06030 [Methylophilaceae bacterium]
MTYVVETYDAFDAPPERRHLVVGRFNTTDKALKCAKNVVDSYLRNELSKGKSLAEAGMMFSCHGEIPMIFGEPEIDFNAFDYADARTSQLSLEKQIQNLAEDAVVTPLECMPQKLDVSNVKNSNSVVLGKSGKRLRCFFAWVIGVVIFLVLGLALRFVGEQIEVSSNIDYGEFSDVVGTGLTSYGLFTMVFAFMIAVRAGISIFKGRVDGGYARHDNIRFIACLLGVLAAAIVGAILFLVFRGFSGWVAPKIHFILEVSSWIAIWFLIKKWNRDE